MRAVLPGHLLDTDGSREVADHHYIGEGGATGASTVERGRHLAERPGQMHAICGRFRGQPAGASQPRHRGASAIGLRAAVDMKALQATQALCFESVDGKADIDNVGAQFGCREAVNRLTNECVDAITQALSGIRDGARFHAHILPNIRSPQHGQCV
jgi:hypothetical protein